MERFYHEVNRESKTKVFRYFYLDMIDGGREI